MPNLSFQIITLPVCSIIALNLFMHYFYVCTVRPGFVDEPPAEPTHNILWAKRSRPRKGTALTGRVKWSSVVNITRAETTQCSKCGQMKPEVSRLVVFFAHRSPAVSGPITVAFANDVSSSMTTIVPWVLSVFNLRHPSHMQQCASSYSWSVLAPHLWTGINQCVGLHNERHFVLFLCVSSIDPACPSWNQPGRISSCPLSATPRLDISSSWMHWALPLSAFFINAL